MGTYSRRRRGEWPSGTASGHHRGAQGGPPGSSGPTAASIAATAVDLSSMVARGFTFIRHGGELGPDHRQVLFGCAMPELFALPIEAKQRNVSRWGPFKSYLGNGPSLVRESLRVENAADVARGARIGEFAHLVCPQHGSPAFWICLPNSLFYMYNTIHNNPNLILH